MTWPQGGGQLPPNILPTKRIKRLKIVTYKEVYINKAKID